MSTARRGLRFGLGVAAGLLAVAAGLWRADVRFAVAGAAAFLFLLFAGITEAGLRLHGREPRGGSWLPGRLLAAVEAVEHRHAEHEAALRAALQRERVATLEAEMRTAAIEEARRRAEELTAELEAFTFSVSHDLAVPLRTMGAFLDLLTEIEGHRLGEDGREYLQRATDLTARMQELVTDLLTLSRMRSDGDLELEAVRIGDVVAAVTAEVETALGRTIELEVVGGDEVVRAPRARLRAILQNLVQNGAKYNEHERPTIRVVVDGSDRSVTILVVDDGFGIPEEDRGRIFDVFARGTNHRGLDGTGAGLAIVRRAARSLGGDVWLESSGPEGSTFCVLLPRDTEAIAA
ncbi:MAG TPA: HAMP domain-containing histidine kinase [Actinobacteria bacterium]|nr:HAMP domain-containing histidine kinase [Actinomycetota bacterium]